MTESHEQRKEHALMVMRWAKTLQSTSLANRFMTYIQLYGEGMEGRVDDFLGVAQDQHWLKESNVQIYRRFKKFMEPYAMAHGRYERAEYLGQLWLTPEAVIILEDKLGSQEFGRREKVKAISDFIVAENTRFAMLEAKVRTLSLQLQSYVEASKRFDSTLPPGLDDEIT